MTKKTIIIPALLSMSLLTACGENMEKAADYSSSSSYTNDITYDNESVAEEYNADSEASEDTNSTEKENNTSSDVIRKEMLVYSCTMTVDVLDFDTAHSSFKNNLETYGAFIETENYNSGSSGGRYYDPDTEKWRTFTATVRVPSEDYDEFCEKTAELGDLRSKNASVENMSREYYDLSATLEIYEAKEKRYMELLSTITDEQYAITVENQLTDIQVDISKLKTRMNDIQTDVAYSYVYLTMNEVKEYIEEPVKTDTFMQRLKNTVSKATSNFLSIMESLLFIFIYIFPHLAVICIVVFIVLFIIKRSMKKRSKKQTLNYSAAVQPTEENNKDTDK